VDINRYLRAEVVRDSLDGLKARQNEVAELFGELLQQKRFDDLLRFHGTHSFSLKKFLELCAIEYVAPADAASTWLPSGSVDFHTSHKVLEHIPPEQLVLILKEGNRIIRPEGLFVHMVDYSDHFSHSDEGISRINFLQYSDAEWAKYAGNKYMYMNRLRHDDILKLFESADHRILTATTPVDERSRRLLETGGLQLHERFADKPLEVLSIWGSWIISQPAQQRYQS
jgi:hypothetical protein